MSHLQKLAKPKNNCNVFDFMRFGPILDDFNLIVVHSKSIWSQSVTKILNHILMKRTFMVQVYNCYSRDGVGLHMFLMISRVVRVDQDVIEVNEYAYIQQVGENIVHEMLECGWSIGKSKGHNTPFKRTIMSREDGFPLITFVNLDKMVSILEINFSEELSLLRSVQEVGDVGKQIIVFLCDLVEVPEINTELKGTIFLLDKQDWSTAWRILAKIPQYCKPL